MGTRSDVFIDEESAAAQFESLDADTLICDIRIDDIKETNGSK